MSDPWAELIDRFDARGLPAITLVCPHGAARSEDLQAPAWQRAVRLLYDSLDAQFSDEEMSSRVKAATTLRTLLGRRLEEQYGCLDGYLPFEIEEDE